MPEPFVADERLTTALSGATGPFPVCNTDGRVIGYVSPTRPTADHLQPLIGEDEIRQRFTDPDAVWVSAADVEARMRELKCTR